jgi:hypothetical protein
MISEIITEKFITSLNQLKEELSLYKNESDLWIIKGDIKNTPGNLALHLIGNLKHFIGATIGSTGYVRNRDKEFADKNVSRAKLLSETDEVIATLKNVLPTVKDEDVNKTFPIEFAGKKVLTVEMLFQLYGHFNYHLGQINYHRRLVG